MAPRLRFGVFDPPLHAPGENPTLAIQRDLELAERLDQLGFDELWVGEHHSLGYEIVPAHEVFLAAASQRTQRIHLGTGVVSLPYHHPLIVADRIVFLDHLTQGRAMLGVGPGAFPSDAHMMGLDYLELRRNMVDALEAVIALIDGDEPVTRETDRFVLRDARLNLRPCREGRFEIAVASTLSPSGPALAGRFGVGLLSLSATSPDGFAALRNAWGVAEEEAARHGQTVDRASWRLVGFYHLAETEAQARRDVRSGMADFYRYFAQLGRNGVSLVPQDTDDPDAVVDFLNNSGIAVIGTPDRMADQLRRLQDQTGGFGAYLAFGHELADREATLRSHELMARHVFPQFQGHGDRAEASFEFGTDPAFVRRIAEAWERAEKDHAASRAAADGPAAP